ncbi:2320_t:CDS:2, partial [Scutellospora calospora]
QIIMFPNSFFFNGNNESIFYDFEENSAPMVLSSMPFIPNVEGVSMVPMFYTDSTAMKLSDQNTNAIDFQSSYRSSYIMNYNQNRMYPYDEEGISYSLLYKNPNLTEQYSMPTLESNSNISLKSSMPNQILRIQQPVLASQSSTSAYSSKDLTIKPKKYKCDHCQKLFVRPSQLKTHIYTHTGTKPFKCTFEGCGRCFSVASNLQRHQKIHTRPSLPKNRKKYAK